MINLTPLNSTTEYKMVKAAVSNAQVKFSLVTVFMIHPLIPIAVNDDHCKSKLKSELVDIGLKFVQIRQPNNTVLCNLN